MNTFNFYRIVQRPGGRLPARTVTAYPVVINQACREYEAMRRAFVECGCEISDYDPAGVLVEGFCATFNGIVITDVRIERS